MRAFTNFNAFAKTVEPRTIKCQCGHEDGYDRKDVILVASDLNQVFDGLKLRGFFPNRDLPINPLQTSLRGSGRLCGLRARRPRGTCISRTRGVRGRRCPVRPEICFGAQSRISLLATTFRNFRLMERRQRLGCEADCQASSSARLARYAGGPPCRATSRLTVDTGRCKHLAISRSDEPEASPREISSRSRSESARSARRRTAGAIPP